MRQTVPSRTRKCDSTTTAAPWLTADALSPEVGKACSQKRRRNSRWRRAPPLGVRTRLKERPARTPCQTAPLVAGAIKPFCSYGASYACDGRFSSYHLFGWAETQNLPSLHSVTVHRLICALGQASIPLIHAVAAPCHAISVDAAVLDGM